MLVLIIFITLIVCVCVYGLYVSKKKVFNGKKFKIPIRRNEDEDPEQKYKKYLQANGIGLNDIDDEYTAYSVRSDGKYGFTLEGKWVKIESYGNSKKLKNVGKNKKTLKRVKAKVKQKINERKEEIVESRIDKTLLCRKNEEIILLKKKLEELRQDYKREVLKNDQLMKLNMNLNVLGERLESRRESLEKMNRKLELELKEIKDDCLEKTKLYEKLMLNSVEAKKQYFKKKKMLKKGFRKLKKKLKSEEIYKEKYGKIKPVLKMCQNKLSRFKGNVKMNKFNYRKVMTEVFNKLIRVTKREKFVYKSNAEDTGYDYIISSVRLKEDFRKNLFLCGPDDGLITIFKKG